MKDPLVSVYVVNHNYGRFLKQSVESVLAQDYNNYHQDVWNKINPHVNGSVKGWLENATKNI